MFSHICTSKLSIYQLANFYLLTHSLRAPQRKNGIRKIWKTPGRSLTQLPQLKPGLLKSLVPYIFPGLFRRIPVYHTIIV